MNKPRVSVIIPAYNSAQTLGAILDDILSQTEKNIEIIVVDDGSADSTKQIAQKYALNDARLIIISQENAGPSAARNKGLDQARGKYVMFFDADDSVDNKIIEIMLGNIESADEISIVEAGCVVEESDNHGNTKTYSMKPFTAEPHSDNKKRVLLSLRKNGLFHSLWNKIYRASIIKDNNIRFRDNIKNGEDLIFNLEYMRYASKYNVIPDTLYYYKRATESDSVTSKKNAANRIFEYRKAMYSALKVYTGGSHRCLTCLVGVRWFISSILTVIRAKGIL